MLPLKAFYLLRHGETVANAAHIAAGGQFDTPLNDNGIAQAKALSACVNQLDVKPQAIFHSNMQRARDTATIINDNLSLSMSERGDLREHDLGEWDGQSWEAVLPKLENKETPIGGESETQFATRIQSALTDVMEICNDNTPLVVAHGGLFHALGTLYSYGISKIQNCHLHYFEPHPEYALFPWKVWQFDVENNELIKRAAPFCSTLANQD